MSRGRPKHPDVLTPAEWRIANAVRHGMSNKTISRRAGISLDAVKYHVANARAKLGLTGRTDLKHWRGAPSNSQLSRKGNAMTTQRGLGHIGQIARHVNDINASVQWYRDILGLPFLFQFGDLAFFDCDGIRLFLSSENEGGGTGNSVLYFSVDDINAAHDSLAEKGVGFLGAPHMIFKHPDGTEEWMAFFNDPDGNPLAIMARV